MKDKSMDISKFLDDIEFMAALFYNNMLNKYYIKQIADNLTSVEPDDNLIAILLSDNTDEINANFQKYIENKHISIKENKRFLIKKIFQYILDGKLDLKESIMFINFEVSNHEDIKNWLLTSIFYLSIRKRYEIQSVKQV
jgi:hypothetical protein